MPAVLKIEEARIAYGSNVLLDRASFALAAGDVCVLSGPNGCGKTSLLRAAMGLAPIASGAIESTFRRPAYVPQFQSVDRQFPCTIRDVLRMVFPGVSYGWRKKDRAMRDERIDCILEQLGLEHRRDQQLRDSSGGEIQRAMIGRALVRNPDLLALDEPTASLDAAGKNLLFDLLRNLHQTEGTTIWTISHDLEEWRGLATRRMRIDAGGVLGVSRFPDV